jgi:hypothetical protein
MDSNPTSYLNRASKWQVTFQCVPYHTLVERTWVSTEAEVFPFTLLNDCLAETWSGSEEGSYLRLIDCCITQL